MEDAQKNAPESYKCLALSTGHLTEKDMRILTGLAGDDQMVFERECGFFIKLYESAEVGEDDSNYRDGFSSYLLKILDYALANGYRMIEFDRDVEVLDLFPTHHE